MPRRPLLGNWQEEEAYERDRKRLIQGHDGTSVDARAAVATMARKVRHHTTPCALAPVPADGCVRFYTPVMLQNGSTLGFLSVDLDDRVKAATGWQVASGTAPAEEAQLRNTVVLAPGPVPPTDAFPIPKGEEDMLHYGQPFYIMSVPALCEDPLSLMSESKSPSSCSKVTGKYQNVYFSPDGASPGAVWCVDFLNPGYREDMRDQPVKADDLLVVRHVMTNMPLVSVKETFVNDFGPQYEVGAGRIAPAATRKKGFPMADENVWVFIHDGQGCEDNGAPSPAQ
ncbi:calpain-like cysteine peptidase [Strigomonas culicis]|uniref:Calpain-like cysteine peptidase n=1 Tax=Strigomonas culicis TaxID=28005 RepID=S9VPY3_9TRYP|nr:calpain-like cysteine peptidase [Strigomonas culicis]|eukprot:EPY29106.1 calpain-like cysteine peptidase [Strigomonas culicis]